MSNNLGSLTHHGQRVWIVDDDVKHLGQAEGPQALVRQVHQPQQPLLKHTVNIAATQYNAGLEYMHFVHLLVPSMGDIQSRYMQQRCRCRCRYVPAGTSDSQDLHSLDQS
jgi:hypothetical protein